MNFKSRVPKHLNGYRLGAGLVALATATALMSAQPAWAADTDAEETKDTRDTIIVTGERESASTAS
jgi:outer membrane cobalamin receptor